MDNFVKNLDPRLILQITEGYHAIPSTVSQVSPVNGILVLSQVGVHFYMRNESEHTILGDTSVTKGNGISLDYVSALLLKPLGTITRFYYPGFGKSKGYTGMGHLIAGTTNLIKRAATKDARALFLEIVEAAKKAAPPLPGNSQMNPHLARIEYYINASALGPAIYEADQALEGARLQGIIAARGSSFFERASLSPAEIAAVKRQRAWLMIEGKRYDELKNESKMSPETDAELKLVYGIASLLSGQQKDVVSYVSFLAEKEPDNVRGQAGKALSFALQQQKAKAQGVLDDIEEQAKGDRYALLLMGIVAETMGERNHAIDHYVASVRLSHGYYQGAMATERALLLARKIGRDTELETAQNLTNSNPNLREAWEGLAIAAKNVGNANMTRVAQEHVTAMQGSIVDSKLS
jgi:tetratricopeptide (TPR) repeat protein